MLVAYDGVAFTFDAAYNPQHYYNGNSWILAWENGRNLARAVGALGKTVSYTYDADGLRTSKTVKGVTHNYYYAGGKLLQETYSGNILEFFYDQNGRPFAFKCNGTLCYYITNLQGDVMYLVNGAGATVASYEYDPYGNIVSQSGAMAEVNPLRYRGYYYDTDTGFYYLQSRYYDPAIGRFLNADILVSTGQGLLGCNMFAYCNNNPISYRDSAGNFRQDSTSNTEVIMDPEGNRPQTLADYIARQNRYNGVMEEEKRWGRIYRATMDSAAENALDSIDEAMFFGVLSLKIFGGVPGLITVAGSGVMGFLYGAVRGFVNAMKQ